MSAALLLASTSPWRASMLRDAGVEIETVRPSVDEEEAKASLRAEGVRARDQADALAEMKACRTSARHSGRLVIGADQILAFGGEALDKPADQDEARQRLSDLRGARHDLYSAAVIALDGAPIWRHIGAARLTMRPFTDAFLDDYLARVGEAATKTPGAYAIEGLGGQLFSRVEGDYFSILGLPLLELLGFLRVRGVIME